MILQFSVELLPRRQSLASSPARSAASVDAIAAVIVHRKVERLLCGLITDGSFHFSPVLELEGGHYGSKKAQRRSSQSC
jgi:hypothetical protein